ncbi:RNA 2'-phosphotransferase [Dysgonomonas macrotermitis]|uniref:Probable RNA 2'-phosphotransferase n=1 Tax=Dysgonomonas macrotermitis TaxID=1346286 RepID=A0A1M4WCY2_9BACT|nr:RNA 2'-phosphotransferase [Dysgonomonas macrotermitis]SHE78923.1 putative RNA 2'-phosphotransferase [Dysgonomonas macrotermitis]
MTEQDKKRIGKFLSLILRHDPQKIGIELDEQGWAKVSELIEKCKKHRYHFSREDLIEIVETNDKQRYSFNEKRSKIRANQGHSIDIDLALSPTEPPEYLYHGTATRFLSSIMEQGIVKGSRQHVHLSKNKETADKVGSRHGKPAILTIMSGKMYTDGILFYQSENGVWLTDYVDTKYISE